MVYDVSFANIDVKGVDRYGETALIKASRQGEVTLVKYLMDRGSDLNAADHDGRTSLMFASREGHFEIVQKLIESGADVNAVSLTGRTALMWACQRGHVNIVKALVEGSKANVNLANKEGSTALMMASETNLANIVRILIEAGADINAVDKDDFTALMKASQMSKVDARFLTTAKLIDKYFQRDLSAKDILQGRIQVSRMLVDSETVPIFITEEYIKDCTNNFADDFIIGKGIYGTTFYGEDRENENFKYVIQRATFRMIAKEQVQSIHDIFRNEIAALTRARHPNLARLIGYSINEFGGQTAYILYQYSTHGSLLDVLQKHTKRTMLLANLRVKILYEVARAIQVLHKGVVSSDGTSRRQFFHRDIKASNIFLESNFTAKLMDCGLSTLIDDSDASTNPSTESSESSSLPKKKLLFETIGETNVFGTPGYTCPAYLIGSIPYDFACDIYSFGVVMLELLTGWLQIGQSKDQSSDQDLVQKFQDKSTLLENIDKLAGDGWFHILDDLCDLALSCVASDPKARPPISEVLESVSDVYTRLILSPNSTPVSSPSK